MTQYEYEQMQDLSWMYETSDDVLEDCFAGDVDLDNVSYSHSFDSTELEEKLLREHEEVMDKLRNLPKRNCAVPGDYHYDEEGRQIDDLPF